MSPSQRPRQAAGPRGVAPGWLTETARLAKVPVPWPDMLRAAVAICLPLAIGLTVGDRVLGLLIAMGGLLGTVVDKGGPYAYRIRRVACTAVFGGAAGLAIGSAIHGRGWVAVLALILVAGASAVMTAIGDVGSVTGLQLLVYASLGVGPLGALRPWWHTALGFVLGTVWALLLTVPGWLLSPREAEQRSVAAVYRAIAAQLDATGTPQVAERRRDVTAAFNSAYDTLLRARAAAHGQGRLLTRLMALLNQANLVAEAAVALANERNRPPDQVIDTVKQVADAIGALRRVRIEVRPFGTSPGAVALHDALAEVVRLTAPNVAPSAPARRSDVSLRTWLRAWRERLDALRGRVIGRFSVTFALRLMASIGVAGVLIEFLPLKRSYWVLLTVAIVLKPDFGSVFARAVQRGLGTILGAMLGAVILAAVPYGLWLLIPFGILAALLPYGQARNYGLFATFLTPLVVLLIDLLAPAGWHLALDRLLDTVLGCAVVLLVGYAPWPASWHAHLPGQFAQTIRDVCNYMDEALVSPQVVPPGTAPGPAQLSASGLPSRPRLRRAAYRALADLRAEFQRTMSEPGPIGRRVTAWWPALVALEEVVDAVAATNVAIAAGAPAPAPDAVRQLCEVLGGVAGAVGHDSRRPQVSDLPTDPALVPVTDAVRSVLAVLTGNKPPALATS